MAVSKCIEEQGGGVSVIDTYSVSITPLKALAELKKEWLDLENRSNGSFFLSWSWIGAWISTFNPDCYVLKVHQNQHLVALALLTRSQSSQWNRFPSSRIHIHQKGDSASDQIWTEYNGLLVSDNHRIPAISATMSYLQTSFPDWDELVIGAITKEEAGLLESVSGLSRYDLWHSAVFGVDLQKVAGLEFGYLARLSKNTRYQIRRSLKLYKERTGDIQLLPAQDVSEALAYLEEIAPFHLARWGQEIGESGFANPGFVKFHQTLIKESWDNQQIDFIKILSGDRVLGYFYNFLYRGTVYFYLSGLCAETDSKLKPGLSGHSLCIQSYADKGFKYYDFMGGDDRYKASLGIKQGELYQISLQRDRLKFKIENVLRKIKQSLTG